MRTHEDTSVLIHINLIIVKLAQPEKEQGENHSKEKNIKRLYDTT